MNTLPKDPVMLLSFVNTQLRDHYRRWKNLPQPTRLMLQRLSLH